MKKTKTEKRKKALEILERSLDHSLKGLKLFQPPENVDDMAMIMYYQEKIQKTKNEIERLKGMI